MKANISPEAAAEIPNAGNEEHRTKDVSMYMHEM